MSMSPQGTKAATKGRKRKRPFDDGSYALQNDQVDNSSTTQIQYLKPPTRNLLSLPFELYSLIVSHLKRQKSDITALSQTCSTLHDRTIPLLYETISIRVCPTQPLCVPPPLRRSKSKKKKRLTGSSGGKHDDAECTSDVHKLLHSRLEPVKYVRTLRVVPAESDLPSWQFVRRVISNSTRSTRHSLQSGPVTHQESFISLNIAFLVERIPKLAILRWEVDSFIGRTLHKRLCNSSISSIRVGASDRNIHPTCFLHQDHQVVAPIPTLLSLSCASIPNALQLRQIGTFVGLNPQLTDLALGLQVHFVEELIPDGPEGLGILIRAIVEAQRASPAIPSSATWWPHPLSLRELHLSFFTMDEDAEKALCFLVSHCPLVTLSMVDVAVYRDLSTFFGRWRRPEALSYLRHVMFETNTLDEHAIDFPALVSFLIYLGGIPHKLQTLVFAGGWRFLNMENAAVKALKASTTLDGLRTLVWESCVTKWCDDCASARVTRREMSIFADVASCCHNVVSLGIPGLFISDNINEDSEAGSYTLPFLHSIPRLRQLVYLHIQHIDILQPEWYDLAMAAPALKAPTRDTGEESEYFVQSSPKLDNNDVDDELFRLVARAIAIMSLESSDSPRDSERRSHDILAVTFGVLRCVTRVWRTWVKRHVSNSTAECGTEERVNTYKGRLPIELIQQQCGVH